ncbi:MAG: acyl-CoA carboxylase subunit beta [Gemmatimonadota bacterium]|jgi:acetyl-CoA carboxylase carboxyltransferase component|nr:acyl-CoA carboxylase subunit beta [Gemmatimonadota bacterium]
MTDSAEGEGKRGSARDSRLRILERELRELEARVRMGGGPEKAARQHERGKLTARERIALLADPRSPSREIGLLVAWDRYNGEAPAAGVVTALLTVHGREVVVVANDATVKAGSWWPETITKILRAQEIAMRCRIPIIYLVDSAGVNLPWQGGVFPGQYGAARIFFYNSVMRRFLRVPQIAAVMGQCIAGGAYLPALSDVILMVEGSSFMGLGGPNLVRGATGQVTDAETLGGAFTHNATSGVAHFRLPDDRSCIARIRDLVADLPAPQLHGSRHAPRPPALAASEAEKILPDDHRQPYDVRRLLSCILDDGDIEEFQADYAPEIICGRARIEGITIGLIANTRGMLRDPAGGTPKLGGIIYSGSAEKAARFIDTMNHHGTPVLFVQDVSGFMVGVEAEQSGIIRSGARMVEAMATATVPRIVLTINHASGAGYYAMAGQGFDPDFIFSWPSGRMGVMDGDSAVVALFGGRLDKLRAEGGTPDAELQSQMDSVRADYETQLDARHAAARGFVDAIITPGETRTALALALRAVLNSPRTHIGPFGSIGE